MRLFNTWLAKVPLVSNADKNYNSRFSGRRKGQNPSETSDGRSSPLSQMQFFSNAVCSFDFLAMVDLVVKKKFDR